MDDEAMRRLDNAMAERLRGGRGRCSGHEAEHNAVAACRSTPWLGLFELIEAGIHDCFVNRD